MSDSLAAIARIQDATHAALGDLVADGPLAILDFPDIRNCGDSAIWLGEMAYLDRWHGQRPAYVSRRYDFSREALLRKAPEGTIFLQGGGTFGDIWGSHQDFREHVLAAFPDRQIVQFPQSIHFNSPARLDQAARAIGRHRNFTLLVRDEASRRLAQQHFDCEVRLCPDMAFCIGPIARSQAPTLDVLAMLRGDAEKAEGHDPASLAGVPVEDWIVDDYRRVRLAKAMGAVSALASLQPGELALRKFDAAARNRLARGVRQLSRARAIVTDRLHVHIVSMLMGIPHAVLDNNYGKVRNFMAAFSGGTDLTFLPSSLDEGVAWARERASAGGPALSAEAAQ